jgi:hypothetical protein
MGDETPPAGRRELWQARIVCMAVFGPYVTGSARTEQIIVFTLFAWVVITGWPRMVVRQCGVAPFLVAWLSLYVIVLIATAFRPFDPGFYGSQPDSHALAAFLLPIALLTLTWYWTLHADSTALMRAVAPLFVLGMCANAIIEVVQLAEGKPAVVTFLPRFWDADPTAGSVTANAAENGRYIGIFGQPAEAGIAFSVALLLLIWLWRCRSCKPMPATCAAVLLFTGGVLTVSKIFLLGGVLVTALTVLRGPARIRALVTAAVSAAGFWLAGTAGILPTWGQGTAEMGQLVHPEGSLAAQYSAGRYGAGGTLGPLASDVLHAAPVAGFGAGGLNDAYDSLWLQALVVSGVLGVVLTAAVFVMLGWRLALLRRAMPKADWQLATGATVLAAGASLGIPSLTANRAATMLWLILGILVTARAPARGQSQPHAIPLPDGKPRCQKQTVA